MFIKNLKHKKKTHLFILYKKAYKIIFQYKNKKQKIHYL